MTAYDAIEGVINACQVLPTVVAGGQPDLHHLQALQRAGASVILDIRAAHEPRGYHEARTVTDLGMKYVNLPVGPTPLSDQLMADILDVLRSHAGQTIFFHCASGNRIGGPLIAHLILDHDMEEEDAIEIARRAGLRGPEILAWGLEYARRNRP